MSHKDKHQDPQPDRGRDNEHRPDHGNGRPVKPSPSAPVPSRTLTELDFDFWRNTTKR